jgi:hypothetical protein
VRLARGAERAYHVVARDPPAGGAAEQVAGVVVEPRADLDLAASGEVPEGHVRLADLVGCRAREGDSRAEWAPVRLGHDQARDLGYR